MEMIPVEKKASTSTTSYADDSSSQSDNETSELFSSETAHSSVDVNLNRNETNHDFETTCDVEANIESEILTSESAFEQNETTESCSQSSIPPQSVHTPFVEEVIPEASHAAGNEVPL